jgi:hypothetical protein
MHIIMITSYKNKIMIFPTWKLLQVPSCNKNFPLGDPIYIQSHKSQLNCIICYIPTNQNLLFSVLPVSSFSLQFIKSETSSSLKKTQTWDQPISRFTVKLPIVTTILHKNAISDSSHNQSSITKPSFIFFYNYNVA